MVRCITLASVLPSRSSTTFGSGSFTNGSPACRARFASMNESSTPESTKGVSGRASCAHNNKPGKECATKTVRTTLRLPALLRALTSSVFWPHGAVNDVVALLPTIQAGTRSEVITPLCNGHSHWTRLHGLFVSGTCVRGGRKRLGMRWGDSTACWEHGGTQQEKRSRRSC